MFMVGECIVYGIVSDHGVRRVGGKQREDGTVSRVQEIAFAEVLTSRGLVKCEVWDSGEYNGPEKGALGFFRVIRPGNFYNGQQAYSGEWMAQPPDLKGLLLSAAANGNGVRARA